MAGKCPMSPPLPSIECLYSLRTYPIEKFAREVCPIIGKQMNEANARVK